MAGYITDKPQYDKYLDFCISEVVGKVTEMINLCREIRQPLQEASVYKQWYHYKDDFREIYEGGVNARDFNRGMKRHIL